MAIETNLREMNFGKHTRSIVEFRSFSATETFQFGARLASILADGDVLCLIGSLGVGKTYLAKGIAYGLGVNPRAVTSPTFTLIQEYPTSPRLYHMDAYRLDNSESFLDLGVDDIVGRKGVCVIEWADRIMDVIPRGALWILIDFADGSEERVFTIRADDSWVRRFRDAVLFGTQEKENPRTK